MWLANTIFGGMLFSPMIYAEGEKQPAFKWGKCESNDDLIKTAEFFAKISIEENEEMMFLMPVNRELQGNALDDSVGYFFHNKDNPKSSFAIVLWIESQNLCLVFDGILVRENEPKEFFNKRNKLLEIIKKLDAN